MAKGLIDLLYLKESSSVAEIDLDLFYIGDLKQVFLI